MTEKLTNCPHCGEKPTEITLYADYYFVVCVCGGTGPKKKTRKEAIAAWNKRFACLDSNGKKVFAGDKVQTKYLSGVLCYVSECAAYAVINTKGKTQWIYDMEYDEEITLIESED